MNMYLAALCVCLLITNLICIFFLFRKSKKPEITLTKDANELLSELLTGGAVVTVAVTNPSDVFQWSPRDSV